MIDADELVEQACATSRLTDFGGSEALVALARLVDDLNGPAHLSDAGELSTRRQLHRILLSRLEVVEQLKVRPDVLERPVTAPIVIAGLPRTGTTFLHQLMARDRQFDFVSYWQARRPVGSYRGQFTSPERREMTREACRHEAVEALAVIAARAPALLQIHPMGADEPDECIVAMQLSLVSLQFELLYRVPGYAAWVTPENRRLAYREFATLLRLLQRPEPGGRWLLKSPGHTMAGWSLTEVFPDVGIVQVHRDPATVVGSFCSLAYSVRRLYSDDVDRADLGREWLGRWAEAAEVFADVRDSMPAERVCDLRYADLVEDPIGTVRSVYEQFGLDLTSEAETAMRRLVEDCRAKPLGHRYSLADYDLTDRNVRGAFAPYLDRFGSLLGGSVPRRRPR